MNATLTEAPKMYETESDISQNRRSELNALMNQRLAEAVDLQMQMKQAHWNVKGPSFIGLHELFDKVDEAAPAANKRPELFTAPIRKLQAGE